MNAGSASRTVVSDVYANAVSGVVPAHVGLRFCAPDRVWLVTAGAGRLTRWPPPARCAPSFGSPPGTLCLRSGLSRQRATPSRGGPLIAGRRHAYPYVTGDTTPRASAGDTRQPSPAPVKSCQH
jgi:hypothetical protein